MAYNIFIIGLLIIIAFQFWYIYRLRKVIEFAAESIKKFGEALLNDDVIRKVTEENESKTN